MKVKKWNWGTKMNVTFATQDVFTGKQDAVLLFTYEEISEAEKRFNEKLGKFAHDARDRKDFSGKKNEILLITQPGPIRYAVLASLGKREKVSHALLREVTGSAARKLQDSGAKHVAVELPLEMDASAVAQAVTEAFILATYKFTKYKSKNDTKELQVTVVSKRTGVAAKNGVDVGKHIAESVNIVRTLQNTGPSDMTPELFVREAQKIVKSNKLKSKVLDKKQLEKGGWGGILAVGGGSENEPRLLTVEYSPKKASKTIAVVGKGITFDTGGYSIKPGEFMSGMKFDMSGAAAVLGILRNAAKLKLPVRVIGIMGLAENAISGSAYKPDDIVRTKSGKTIEIANTDAEGRVVLADALHHATTFKPDLIIDLATLTGAAMVALGDVCCAALGNNDERVQEVVRAGESSGELAWQLPLWDKYEKDIDSKIADMKNLGFKRLAGTISAAMLLKQFVGDYPWVHLDIAGVDNADSRQIFFTQGGEGGTGFGVRLVTEYLRTFK